MRDFRTVLRRERRTEDRTRLEGRRLVGEIPGTTRNLQGSVPSYTTAPVSEWLGSHVYAALGIPVHETVLGIRDGRIVCACRDFTFPDSRLVNFHDLKNSLSDDEPGFTEDASTGSGVVLADVRSAIHRIPVLRSIDGVSDRFWDMFVVDAFIRNIDRNNTNWGVLRNPRGEFSSRRSTTMATRSTTKEPTRESNAVSPTRISFAKTRWTSAPAT